MPTKKAVAKKIVGKKVSAMKWNGTPSPSLATPPPSPVSLLGATQDMFARLKEIRIQLAGVKSLYAEHDKLMTALLPLFIEITPNKFIVHREITIGTEKYRYSPNFWDEKDAELKARVWKSTAHKSGTIE